MPVIAVGLAVALTACGAGGAAAPTDYGRPTTTFTTEPVRTTQPPTSLPQQPVTGGDVAADSATSEIPEGIMVDPLTGQWTYQIVAGDVPGKLAERFGVAVDDLAAANVNTPGYSSYLIGAVVIIPHGDALADTGSDAGQPQETAPDENACVDGRRTFTHEIVRGDNPSKLAKRYDTTVADLESANANTPGYSSYLLGTQVIIPC